MNISYTGKYDALPPKQRAKLEAKLQKLSKMLERRGEKEMHIILTQERFLHKVEITVNAWDHAIVGIGSGPDPVIAASDAADKLEKQLLKLRTKWRDTKRVKDKEAEAGSQTAVAQPAVQRKSKSGRAASSAAPTGKNAARKKVFRVNHSDGSKPMTLEEAMLELEEAQDYLVYRDANTDRVTVLMRRSDGNFDLIES